jgi:signal transduction histidine kinase
VAHEINNPLGGLLNALDTLKRHGDRPGVAERSIALLERGLVGIRDIVRAMIETYRPGATDSSLSEADLEDLRLLIAPEVRRRNQTLHWTIQPGACDAIEVPSAPVRQAVLNLLLNASAAAGPGGDIRLAVSQDGATLTIDVVNSGPGMSPAARQVLETGSGELASGGVGLRVIGDRTRSMRGTVRIDTDGAGTCVSLAIPLVSAAGRAA